MERKVKHLHLTIKSVGDDGSFSGYGSTFGGKPDSYGDIVDPGAFTKTLADRGDKVKLLWQHIPSQPIGIFTSLEEDAVGLKFTGQLNLDVQQGREAYALLKQGAIDSMSIGYITLQSKQDNDDPSITHLIEVKLYEISLVTFPANEEATVTAVKTAFDELSEPERRKVLNLIHSFKQSLPSDEPPIAEASVEKHSEPEGADAKANEEPQSSPDADVLHFLENIKGALTKTLN